MLLCAAALLSRCILHALAALHNAGFGHADLRWPNVIVTGRQNYVLIDLEDAIKLGTAPDPAADMPKAWQEGAVLVDGKYVPQSDLRQLASLFQGSSAGDCAHHLAMAATADEAISRINQACGSPVV
jgi:hypothetical protein